MRTERLRSGVHASRQEERASRRPLRILHLLFRLAPNTAGGHQSYALEIGRALVRRGHEFHVLACAPGSPHEDYDLDGVHVHRRPGLPTPAGASVRGLPMTFDHLHQAMSHRRELARLGLRFDIVESPDLGAGGLMVSRSSARAMVVRLHSPMIIEAPFYSDIRRIDIALCDRLERRLVRRALRLTAATAQLPDRLRALGWLDQERVEVFPNPVDVSFWSGVQPVEATRPVVLVAGRVEARKAPELAVQALSELGRTIDGAELVFLGRSSGTRGGVPYRSWLEKLAREVGARCRFFDEVPRDRLPSIFGQARVVAVPSWQEGFSNVALEAMAAGRPVVCTSSTGIAELVAEGGAGTIVPPGDPAALSGALAPYLSSTEHAAAVGRRGRELVASRCAADQVATAVEDCYYAALAVADGER